MSRLQISECHCPISDGGSDTNDSCSISGYLQVVVCIFHYLIQNSLKQMIFYKYKSLPCFSSKTSLKIFSKFISNQGYVNGNRKDEIRCEKLENKKLQDLTFDYKAWCQSYVTEEKNILMFRDRWTVGMMVIKTGVVKWLLQW